MKKTYVPPKGDPLTAKYIIVGEQPGKQEVINGQPFCGPAGQALNECLHSAQILLSECYFTNVIKDLDAPLEHYIKFVPKKSPIISDDGLAYINELKDELNQCSAKVIIALGNVALYAITDRMGITNWRGSILESRLVNKTVIPTFHPATIIAPKFQYLNRHCIVFDLRRASELLQGMHEKISRQLIIKPNFDESMNFLLDCERRGLTGETLAYDIEISNLEVSCISFSYDKTIAMCVPFTGPNGDYFSVEHETEIWKLIARILENPKIAKVGQNLVFDGHFLLRKYGIAPQNLHDTMIAQRILMPEYRIGLQMIASIWTDIPYYKEDGKFWLKGQGSWEQGWQYNCLDSIVCAEAWPKQLEEIKNMNNLAIYEETRKLILPCVYMMERGIKINTEEMLKRSEFLLTEITKNEQLLNELAGQPLNANSPKQLKEYFYIKKKLPSYKGTSGQDSTDEEALKRIARKGFKEASVIMAIRGLKKERSTYLDLEKVDPDGRMRCSYNPVGTRYSRMSSSETIFGTGNNLQNQPHSVLEFFQADAGYICFEADLSQAENRIVAYVGRIDSMIEAFETNQDVHCLTAALISGKTPEEIKAEHKSGIKCSLGGSVHSWRDWGKKANHGLNYDLGYRNFSLRYEIPERDGKLIVERYHQVYPGVRLGFHRYVKTCLETNRVLTNLMGRKTMFFGNLSESFQKDKTLKEAYSCIPQGTVGDIINKFGVNYIYEDAEMQDVELQMQVHDAVKFQISISHGWEKIAELLTKIKTSLEPTLTTHYGRAFVIPVEFKVGLNYGQVIDVKPTVESLKNAYKELTNVSGNNMAC